MLAALKRLVSLASIEAAQEETDEDGEETSAVSTMAKSTQSHAAATGQRKSVGEAAAKKAPTEAPPRKSVGKPAAKKAPKTRAKMHSPAERAPKAANPRSAATANAAGERKSKRQVGAKAKQSGRRSAK